MTNLDKLADQIEADTRGYSRSFDGAKQLNLRCVDWDNIVAALRAAARPAQEPDQRILDLAAFATAFLQAMPEGTKMTLPAEEVQRARELLLSLTGENEK